MGKKLNNIPEPPKQTPVSFSFQFYDGISNKKYCISEWAKEKIALSLTRLKQINEKTFNELGQNAKTLHFHPVDWSQTKKPEKFPIRKANELEPYQFELLGVNSGRARVYGAYSNNVFYIIWFDLNHNIWPSFKKHT